MNNIETEIVQLRPREQMIIPSSSDFNGSAARELSPTRRAPLRLLEATPIINHKIIPLRPDLQKEGNEVFEMNIDHVAPGAGERAIKIQSKGAKKMDEEMAQYEKTGVFTEATARAAGNSFIRLRAIGEGAGIPNISESAWIPEVQESAQACALLKKMGNIIAPKDAHVTEYGRLVMYVWDVDELDYEHLSTRMANAPRAIISEYSPQNEAEQLNKFQDHRSSEFQRKEAIFKGILEGTVDPGVPAVPDEKDNPEDSLLIWGSKRQGNKMYAINPDLDLQDEEELGVTDLWTRGLLAHERDLTLSAPKGKIRLILVLANDEYVRRCCITVTNLYEEDFVNEFVINIDQISKDSIATPFVYGDIVGAVYNDGENYEVYHSRDYCSNCNNRKNNKGQCADCSVKKN